MRKTILFILCCSSILGLQAQSTYSTSQTTMDYGEVREWRNDTTWFYIRNKSSKPWHVLPTFYHQEFQVLSPKSAVNPGVRIRIGVVYYTEEKGKFKLEAPVYISSEPKPIPFVVKGRIKSFHPDALVYCPNLDPKDPKKDTLFFIPPLVSENDVKVEEREQEIDEEEVITQIEEDYQLEPENDSADMETLVDIDADSSKEVLIDTLPPIKETKPKTVFGDDYAINNLVFLIDVSGSMRYGNKLESLKGAMKELILALRPEDKVSIITYASRAKIVYETQANADKMELIAIVDSLQANGSSYGKEGLNKAYRIAQSHLVEDGNNSILLATDGLFNYNGFAPGKLYRRARIERIKQVKLSTLGFGRDKEALKFLQKLASAGGGLYLNHQDEGGSLPLIGLIQEMSKISEK